MGNNLFREKPILKTFGTCLLFIALIISAPSNVLADFNDGLMAFHKGDYVTAFREFRSLAEEGHTKAQRQLGIMYEMGLGVKLNYTEASQWYQKAAIQGDRDAQKRLIEMRKKGPSRHLSSTGPRELAG
jgi:TPR repeat protein